MQPYNVLREPSLDSRYCGNYGGVYSSRGLGIQTLHSNGEMEVLCAHERTKPESRFSRSSQQWRWVCLARPAYRFLVKGQRAPLSWSPSSRCPTLEKCAYGSRSAPLPIESRPWMRAIYLLHSKSGLYMRH